VGAAVPAGAPKIIARLPFVERPDHPAGMPAFVIAQPLADGAARDVVIESVALDRCGGLSRRAGDAGRRDHRQCGRRHGPVAADCPARALEAGVVAEALRQAGARDLRIVEVGAHAAGSIRRRRVSARIVGV